MGKKYGQVNQSELILRDKLALERTTLANERTFLAYLRSAVALMLAGLSIIHFSAKGWYIITGFASIPFAILIAIVGLIRYKKIKKQIKSAQQ